MTKFADTSPDYKEVSCEVKDWVATITINRPHNHSAYGTAALVELAHAFRRAAFDDKVAALVETGTGDLPANFEYCGACDASLNGKA